MDYCALIPCYACGNAVTAVGKDGQTNIIHKSLKSFINRQLKENNLDMKSIRQNFSPITGRSSIIPLPLGVDVILIPVKVRRPLAPKDGAYGYVDMASVESVAGREKAVIALSCGMEIKSLETKRTVVHRIKLGEMVKEKFTAKMIRGWELKEGMMDMMLEYDRAATRGDITLLAAEIMKLRKTIEGRKGN